LLEGTTVIRRLGSHAGKRIYFGYDRYVRPELIAYRDALGIHGELVDAVGDAPQLHYLTSAELVCSAVQADTESFGVLTCGTGMGMSIAANKFHGIYAARCMSVEDAELARTINNTNVLCLAAKNGLELNRAIIDTFARTPYTGRKLDELELITRFEGAPVPALRVVRRTA
jgi:ribose 5-phosphate isomerase B